MIQSTGTIRKVDKLGRIMIPPEARNLLGIEEKDGLRILVDEEKGYIILQKATKMCLKCQEAENLKRIKAGHYICNSCIDRLK